jgi:hypothetical protein
MKIIKKHFIHYLSLFAILIAGLIGFYLFSYDRLFQAAVGVAISVSYVAWGIVHHSIHDDLEPSVIVEYILVASLGLVIVFSLIFTV